MRALHIHALVPLALLLMAAPPAQGQDVLTFTQESLAPGASPDGVQPKPQPGQTPDVYVVQSGDTLWDISTKFLGNAFYWPRLWSINDYITNPHWIYPGNRIVFRPGTVIEPPQVSLEGDQGIREGYITENIAFEKGDIPCGPDIHYRGTTPARSYRAPAILEDDQELEFVGKVYKARSGHTDLGEHDLVYLELDDANAVGCGDILTVVHRAKRRVKHPEQRGVRYGGLYYVVGEARILHVQDDVAMAVVRKSYREMRRGDKVTTKIPTDVELEVSQPKGTLEGVLVARIGQEEYTLSSVEETVFIDRGKADGVRVGNSFWLVERKDERISLDDDDPRLPPSVVGRIVVVRVDENSSTGVVVDAAREVAIGQHVVMRVE